MHSGCLQPGGGGHVTPAIALVSWLRSQKWSSQSSSNHAEHIKLLASASQHASPYTGLTFPWTPAQSRYNRVYSPTAVTRHSQDNLSSHLAEMKQGLWHPAVAARLHEPFHPLWSRPPQHQTGSFRNPPVSSHISLSRRAHREPLMAFLLSKLLLVLKGHINIL